MFNQRKHILETLRRNWGKEITRYRNLDIIAYYHNLVKEIDKGDYVENKTCSDLNMDGLFAKLDRTTSCIGQQFLYHILRTYEPDETILKRRFRIAEIFKTKNSFREKVQLTLHPLKESNAYFIPRVIFGELPQLPKFSTGFYMLSLLSITSLFLIFIDLIFIFAVIGISVINIIVNKIYSNSIYEYYAGFSSLSKMLSAARKLSRLHIEELPELDGITKHNHIIKSLNKKLGYLVIDKSQENELVVLFIEYLNMFLLYDLITFLRAVKTLRVHRTVIGEIYETIGLLDSSISTASYLEETKYFTNPVFIEHKSLSFLDVYNPMLKNGMPTSIDNLSKSALITGSNMAGKTTFMRTVGINVILGRTLYICHARQAVFPSMQVLSTIRREDDLEHSKSYYMAEIEEILNFITVSQNDNSIHLILIDEIFRGTNTIERLAASASVLKQLNKTNLVLVTTHDVELHNMLNDEYSMYHFSEGVEKGNLYFDFQLKPGVCSTGNAIKLLEIKGYPKDLVAESKSIAERLRRERE